ncbi:MAG: carboxypeptidase regulatory-like domain-containing protein [Longimicrobiales bacterium]
MNFRAVARPGLVLMAAVLTLMVTDVRAISPARTNSNERNHSGVHWRAMQQSLVRGEVVMEGTGRPVAGGPVVLVAGGRVVARTLTDGAGRFRLPSSGDGPFEVRVRVTGRPETTSAVTDSVVRLVIADVSVDVTALSRAGDAAKCVAANSAGSAGRLWAEAKKALEVEAWGRAERVFSYDVFQYDRVLNAEQRIERERGRLVDGIVDSPSRGRPWELVLREGYAESTPRGDILYAPDGDVLLSDAFTSTHCFRIATGDHGRVGLAFAVLPDRSVVDIEGVMWFDARTAELQKIEFRYTGLDVEGREGPGGGLDFTHLPAGHWTLSRWFVRTPAPGAAQGSREEGAEVIRVMHLNGAIVPVVHRAALIGTVTDSAGGSPVRGATLSLTGTEYEATTNEDGRFYIPELPPGRFQLGVTVGQGDPSNARDVWVASNQATDVTLTVHPSRGTAGAVESPPRMTTLDSVRTFLNEMGLRSTTRVDSLIRVGIRTGELGMLAGRVTDFGTGRPIAGVAIRLPDIDRSVLTEPDGRFAITDIPAGQIVLHAEMIGYATRTERIVITPGEIVEATFGLATQPIVLDPIRVTIRSRWLDSNGFYDRRVSGLAGHFITRADIERRSPAQFTELLRDLPGVSIVSDGVGKLEVRFRRVTTMTGNVSDMARGCEPAVYYDGVPMNIGFDRLHEIPLPFIDGVEVYVGAATPIKFKHPCGVILIWTRRPR